MLLGYIHINAFILRKMSKELPKIYEPQLIEKELYERWEQGGYFRPEKSAGKEKYSIIMPPPNVTGTLHMGHAAMLAIEDILIRHARMQGKRALWLPGTDHAAIATQTKVEKIIKEEGLSRHQIGRNEFLKRISAFAKDSHDTIVNQVRAMGSSCDWSREAYTLDETRTKAVRSVFKMMHSDGLIYRGDRVINWCPRCKSTLADDEVEHQPQKAKLYTFRYAPSFPIAISTTRPETKLGDTAIAVNPGDKRYKKFIGKVFPTEFCGIKLKIKVIADRNIDMNFGTGALGVTPAHSLIDWKMAAEHDLEIIKVIDENADIQEGFGEFSGKSTLEARELAVAILKKQGLIEKEEEIDNNLSVCYRCSTPIEPLPSLQWFIDVNKKIPRYGKSLKELSLAAVKSGVFGREKISIFPERFERDYFRWIENLQDWCISRQIWFGHRIPVWYKDSETYVGVEDPAGDGWQQENDTLDTWFSSGLWTFSTLANSPEQIRIENEKLTIDSDDFKNFHPTDVLETGYDILFFWVARMILMTTYAIGDIPFKKVYLHGLVRDEHGKKMSKSLGNVIDPLDMTARYGTDATRLSLVLGSSPGGDLKLSEEKIESLRNFTNKLWNISRFILGNTESAAMPDLASFKGCVSEHADIWDKWLLLSFKELISKTDSDLRNFRFSQAAENLQNFTLGGLADWYLEKTKFARNPATSPILVKVLQDLLKLWHPFMPFVTEHIHEYLGTKTLLIESVWPQESDYADMGISAADRISVELIQDIITAIRSARAQAKIEAKQKITAVIDIKDHISDMPLQDVENLLISQEAVLKGLRTGVEKLEIVSLGQKMENALVRTVAGINIYLPLAGLVDAEKEKDKAEKRIAQLEKFIQGLEGRLNNESFVSKAPRDVVAAQKDSLAKAKAELNELNKYLAETRS